MICAHFEAHTIALDVEGLVLVPAETGDCRLMQESDEMRLEVHRVLTEAGFERNRAVTDCPVAERCKWLDCPLYARG